MDQSSRTTRLGSWMIAAGVVVVLGAVFWFEVSLIAGADLSIYDNHFRLRGVRSPNPRVAIVAIDEPSLKTIGRWPWPRTVLADIVRRLKQAEVSAVAFDIILAEPERSGEIEVASRLTERLGPGGLTPVMRHELDALVQRADHDKQLASAIQDEGHVILATQFTVSGAFPSQPPVRQGQPLKSAFVRFKNFDHRGLFPPYVADTAAAPIPPLLQATNALGHVNMVPDFDGTTRWEALVIEHHGYYYPSLALESARVAMGLDPTDVALSFGDSLQMGKVRIPIDARARVLIDYAGPAGTFPHYSAADVLKGRISAERLKDRIVFIGATAEATFDLRVTPFSAVLPGVEKHANMAANLLDGRFIVQPTEVAVLFQTLSIVGFPLLLAFVLPRLRPMTSLGAALGLGILVFAGAHLSFRQGLWLPIVYPVLAIGLTFVGITVFRFFAEERQRLWTKRAFQHYVSPDVVDSLMQNPGVLQFGGAVRDLTVMFSDIRDFTTYAERHEPQHVVGMLREHHTRLTQRVMDERGTLDKYIGDAIMAIFGAPIALPDHAERACRAALRMIEENQALHAAHAGTGDEGFRIGIGINSGPMVVGNLGSDQLFNYTVVGDNVNLGARLESLTKEYKTERGIIISDATYEAAKHAIDARPIGEVKVKGKTQPVVIYELLGLKSPAAPQPVAAVSATT